MDERDVLIAKLAGEVRRLKTLLEKKGVKASKPVSSVYSGETTALERANLRAHIEQLEREQKEKQKKEKPKAPNLLKISQIVELIDEISGTYRAGVIQAMACRKALPSVKECDRKTCEHKDKNFVWVLWPNGKTIAYYYGKLAVMKPEDLMPKIGKELSGRVGPWVFDAKTQTWKKDGSDKIYTQEEFADAIYFETHPYAKEEGNDFVKTLKKMQGL